MKLIERLEKYCLTPAMAGFEDEMIKNLKADLNEYVDEVRVDVLAMLLPRLREQIPPDLVLWSSLIPIL